MNRASFPSSKDDRAKLYIHCMIEIKERLAAMSFVLDSPILPLFKQETCYLHLRHICELIAIACLAAQGDFKTQRAFTEEYSPPKIFNALRKLHPNFFPQPSEAKSSNGVHSLSANKKSDAYDEAAVSDLWRRSGDHLHRASVQKYLSRTFGPVPSLNPVRAHIHGLVRLLESHVLPVHFEGENVLLSVNMEDGTGGLEAHFLHLDMEQGTVAIETFRGHVERLPIPLAVKEQG